MKDLGHVYLVGAGPGDPELLTIKAVRALEKADVIVYDRLVSAEILDMAPAGVTRINVGKQPHSHPVPQEEINLLLARLAEAGRVVVRLKGGDPLTFGRGSEEALELARRGLSFEIIPGITSAQGCAAASKVPLTHRGLATGVRYLTGHCRQNMDLDFDWHGLGDPDTTLVVYMGLANIAEISTRLIEHGLDAGTPVLAVNKGTMPDERRLLTTLGNIADEAGKAEFDGPVLFVIGKVAGLAEQLAGTASEGVSDADAALRA